MTSYKCPEIRDFKTENLLARINIVFKTKYMVAFGPAYGK